MRPFVEAIKNYAVFAGRTSRGDYFCYVLINMFLILVISFVTDALEFKSLGMIYLLATVIPSISIGVRRMHDVNQSGWMMFVPVYSTLLALTEGTPGPNQFGPDPSETCQYS